MPPGQRSGSASRPAGDPLASRRPRPSRGRRVRRREDAGFTLIEAIVAITIMGVVMAALTSLLVRVAVVTDQQGSRQVAIQLAADGIDAVRAEEVATLAALPVEAELPVVDNPQYRRTRFVQRCWQPAASTQWCGAASGPVAFFRVRILVTWRDKSCSGSECAHSANTLINASTDSSILPAAWRVR